MEDEKTHLVQDSMLRRLGSVVICVRQAVSLSLRQVPTHKIKCSQRKPQQANSLSYYLPARSFTSSF